MSDRRSYDENRGSSRDRDDRGSRDRDEGRGRDDRGSRDRGDERGRDDRGSRDRGSSRDDDRGSRRGSSSGYQYQPRSRESVEQRARGDSDFDKILKAGIKMWKPNDGDNRIRILPPTWAKAEHYGLDIWVHYGVGADRQTYLDLFKMREEADPINDAREKFAREMNDSKDDKEYLKELTAKKRVLVYLVDRDHEGDGVQAWAMPKGLDEDIVAVSVDKQTKEVLPLDHPEDGFDIDFRKDGTGIKTEYSGVAIARRSSPLGKTAWLDFAMDNPLPDQLNFFEYDHIARAFGGGGSHRGASDRDGRDDRGRDDRGGERDKDRGGRDDRGRDERRDSRDDRGGRDDRSRDVKLTWEDVQNMRPRELEDLIEAEKLDINPKEAKDDQDLADWVCETMKLEKAPARSESTRREVADPEDKLARMRERRERN